MSRTRHTPGETVSLHALSVATGKKPGVVLHLLRSTGLEARYARTQGKRVVFNQRVVDVLHALLGQPHRPLEGDEADWLSSWITSGGTHAP